ncbi:MAG: HAD-IIB family hydrolase, partial [Acidimicrobiia bacterium]|nr:HAD-IIB family hydrolase [Acidimicrobiia bacterium]
GTLFGSDRQISHRTASTLAKVADLGVHLVVASGRSQISIIPRAGNVPFIQWAVCSNGATLYDLSADQRAQVWTIDEAHLAEMFNRFETILPDIVWAWEDLSGHHWTEGFTSAGLYEPVHGVVVPDDARPTGNTLKILVGHRDIRRYDLLDILVPVVPNNLGISTSGAEFVEVTAPGVNKGAGLATLCRQLGVPAANVAAFGDNVNDLEMMAWVGHGFAMANAHHQLKEVSRYVTERTNDLDGVAHTLEQIFDIA